MEAINRRRRPPPPEPGWVVASIVIYLVAFVVCVLFGFNSSAPKPLKIDLQWFVVLAGFYVAAQALQRLLDLLSAAVGLRGGAGVDSAAAEADKATSEASSKLAVKAAGAAVESLEDSVKAAQEAAQREDRANEQLKANKQTFIGACGTLFASLGAGAVGLYLLTALTGGAQLPRGWSRTADLYITALAFAGGSKPLNDLLARIQATKDKA